MMCGHSALSLASRRTQLRTKAMKYRADIAGTVHLLPGKDEEY
jgi:hypothetical protein